MHRMGQEDVASSQELILTKTAYPEPVLRKALYWLAEGCGWQLEEQEDAWVVRFAADCPGGAAQLHRLLNDFLLRARLDAATQDLRRQIVTAALQRLARGADSA